MSTVERDLGRKLEWAAINHYDTDHPHAHVVIRGVDRDGQELRLDRAYISRGLRWRARELATEELGPRHEFEIRRAHAKEIDQEPFTSLDREIERRAKEGRVDARTPAPRNGPIDDSMLLARLARLEGLGLAERVGPVSWKLGEGWKDRLRELGSRGDILKQIHDAISGDSARYHIVRAGRGLAEATGESRVISGRIASKGLSDELKGHFFAVVESPEGAAYHLPLDARGAESLRPGDIVSFTTKPETAVRAVDQQIAHVASAHGSLLLAFVARQDTRLHHDGAPSSRLADEQPQQPWRIPSTELVAPSSHRASSSLSPTAAAAHRTLRLHDNGVFFTLDGKEDAKRHLRLDIRIDSDPISVAVPAAMVKSTPSAIEPWVPTRIISEPCASSDRRYAPCDNSGR